MYSFEKARSAAIKGFTIVAKIKTLVKPESGETGLIYRMEGRRTIGLLIEEDEKIKVGYKGSDSNWILYDTDDSIGSDFENLLLGFFYNEADPKNSAITYQIKDKKLGGFTLDGKFSLSF